MSDSIIDVAIIGAGPYGLSVAAHLKARGVEFRIFGSPMQTWLAHMPEGMRLKSEGFASSLSDPGAAFTLANYCSERAIPYADIGLPVALETFCSYGLAFQRRFVPELENKLAVSVHRSSVGFQICLDNGEVVTAQTIVNATGLSHFDYVPPILSALPKELITHSSRHRTLDHFKGREVAVIGAGASALDLSALLHRAGASVHLVTRKPAVRFHDPPERIPAPVWERMRSPTTGIGPGWRLVFCAKAPLLFRRLPERFRLDAVRRILGPAPGWFIKDEVVGKVPFNLGVTITQANVQNGRVNLELSDNIGDRRNLLADHVIAATGYKVNVKRLTYLDFDIQARIQSIERTPVLSSNFESSVPGLYFVGTSAANTFGPLLRFAYGAGFTARRLSRHLARSSSHGFVPGRSSGRSRESHEVSETGTYARF